MIEKRTVIDQIEITANGVVQVRLHKRLVEGANVLANRIHRVSIAPGQDIDVVMAAVNGHMAQDGYAPVSDYERLRSFVALAHTPEVVAAYAAAAEHE